MSNLLEKASIITTPTAYSDGVLHSVKPSESPYADFTFIRNNPGTRVNASGNIESIAGDLPRIDYRGGCGSLLLEPEATNTANDSNDFTTGDIFEGSNNPSLTSSILTSAQATSPDGTNNAWKLVDNNDGNTGQCAINYFNTNVITNNYNTVSLFVKKQGNNDWVYINNFGFDVTSRSWFNISNGTLGTVASGHTASIDNYGNGWYRIAITFTTEFDLSGSINIRLATSDGATNILKDGTNGVYIYGLQAESHATRQYATSYIPTSEGTGTRAADSATDAGSSDLISSTEGVLYAEVSFSDSGRIAIKNSDVSSDEIVIGFSSNVFSKVIEDGSTIFTNSFSSANQLNQFYKIAFKYKDGDSSLWVDGVEQSISDNFTLNNLNELLLTSEGESFKGNVKCVAVFKEALTDAELTCLTFPNISRILNERVLADGGIIESLECVTL